MKLPQYVSLFTAKIVVGWFVINYYFVRLVNPKYLTAFSVIQVP